MLVGQLAASASDHRRSVINTPDAARYRVAYTLAVSGLFAVVG